MSVENKEILESVKNEINTLGDNAKKNYEELRIEHNKLKEVVERGVKDQYDKNHVDKIATAIAVRQEELDKKNNEINNRIDSFEVAMKRPAFISNVNSDAELKTVNQWICETRAAAGRPLKFDEAIELTKHLEDYRNYEKSFSRFLRKDERLLMPESIKALSVGVDPDGGYTVTPSMSSMILKRLYEIDPIRTLASVETISSNQLEMLIDYDEAEGDWEEETTAISETDTPQFNKKTIAVHALSARPRATQQVLEDSSINIESWLAWKVAEKLGRTEAAAFVTGDGVGKPRGFLTYATGTTYGTVEQVNMGAAATITADGFVKVKYALKEYYLNVGTWLAQRSTVQAAMLLKNGAGDYIWKPGLATDQPSTILGLNLRMSPTMPTIAANSLSIALADWTQAYKIVDRLGITIQRDPYTAKPFVEFYTRKRVGGDVVNFDAIKIGKIAV